MNLLKVFTVCLFLILSMGIGIGNAATITVSTTTDELNTNGSCSLREAIRNVNQGATTYSDCTPSGAYGTSDTINIPAGTYTITIAGSGEDNNATGDFDLRRNVSIVGAGSATTIIDGGDLDRVFQTMPSAGLITASISGVTVQNGSSDDGGGVYAWGSSDLTLNNCIITNNTTTGNGGGILNNGGTVTLNSCTVSSNSADRAAGGILNNSGSVLLSINNSTISNNSSSADNGGGGIFNSAPATVTNSTISGNSTSGNSGGGIVNFDTLTITNCEISGNTTTNRGGGIANSATLTVTGSTISGNSSGANGGGIYNSSTATITSSTISDNTAANGGGIYNSATLTLAGSTLNGNSAIDWGGGLYNNSTASLANVTVSSNQADGGAGIWAQPGTTTSFESCTIAVNWNLSGSSGAGITGNGGPTISMHNIIFSNNRNNIGSDNCYQAGPSLGYNISSDGSCLAFSNTGDMQNTNPLLGELQDNGGSTFTHALLEGSPALDAADPNSFPETDQRGTNRPQGSGPDIGAFELQTGPLADLTGSWEEPLTENCKEKKEGLVCKVKGKFNLRNIGNADAQYVKVRFYLSEDDSFDKVDILLKEDNDNKVIFGKDKKMSFKLTLPVGMGLDGRYIIVYIDADDTTEESNESNNFVIYGQQE